MQRWRGQNEGGRITVHVLLIESCQVRVVGSVILNGRSGCVVELVDQKDALLVMKDIDTFITNAFPDLWEVLFSPYSV